MSIPGQIREMLESWLTKECGVDAHVGVDIHRIGLNEEARPRTIEMQVTMNISMALLPSFEVNDKEGQQLAQSKS